MNEIKMAKGSEVSFSDSATGGKVMKILRGGSVVRERLFATNEEGVKWLIEKGLASPIQKGLTATLGEMMRAKMAA